MSATLRVSLSPGLLLKNAGVRHASGQGTGTNILYLPPADVDCLRAQNWAQSLGLGRTPRAIR